MAGLPLSNTGSPAVSGPPASKHLRPISPLCEQDRSSSSRPLTRHARHSPPIAWDSFRLWARIYAVVHARILHPHGYIGCAERLPVRTASVANIVLTSVTASSSTKIDSCMTSRQTRLLLPAWMQTPRSRAFFSFFFNINRNLSLQHRPIDSSEHTFEQGNPSNHDPRRPWPAVILSGSLCFAVGQT